MGAPMGNRNAAGGHNGSKGNRWMKSKQRTRLVKSLNTAQKKLNKKLKKKKNSALNMSPKKWMEMKARQRKK